MQKNLRISWFATLCALALGLGGLNAGAQNAPAAQEGAWIVKDFRFHTGETLPELKLHYTTWNNGNYTQQPKSAQYASEIARARGMMQLARDTGLTREGLYKALGVKLTATPAHV